MIWTGFLFGLLSSFHCVGMCGPITFLLPLERNNLSKKIFQLFCYHIGRLLTYSLIGLIFGVLGHRLNLFGFQQQLSIIIGIIIIIMILLPNKNILQIAYKGFSKIKSIFGIKLKQKKATSLFSLGLLNGLLPCGMVYIAVFGSLTTQNVWKGAFYMFAFGLGTVPLMTSTIYLSHFLKRKIKNNIMKIIPVFVIMIGILFILRGLGLGIPYLSPHKLNTQQKINTQKLCR